MSTAEFWNERFAQRSYRYGTAPNDFLRKHASQLPQGGQVLSIGEGEGRNAVFLAGLGFQVTALDASDVGLDKTRQLAKAQGVEVMVLQADLNDYEFESVRWDGIINFFCHLPAALRQRVNAGIVRALRVGGALIQEGFTPGQLRFGTGGPRNIDMLWRAEDLRAELSGLDFEILHEIERPLQEGAGHDGMAAVVQLLARKP